MKQSLKFQQSLGAIGAVLVENHEYNKELLLLQDIVIHGIPTGTLRFSCNSWIQTHARRIFFTLKSSYLPSRTPGGLKRVRLEELSNLQGNGDGKCEAHHRIYDYDVYNDLGDPDKGHHYKRAVLGGKQHPYPRRCRTGRPRTQADPLSEVRGLDLYVPRDEAFSTTTKLVKPLTKTLYSMLHGLIPTLETILSNTNPNSLLPHFSNTTDLSTNNGPPNSNLNSLLPTLLDNVVDKAVSILLLHPNSQTSNGKTTFKSLINYTTHTDYIINHTRPT